VFIRIKPKLKIEDNIVLGQTRNFVYVNVAFCCLKVRCMSDKYALTGDVGFQLNLVLTLHFLATLLNTVQLHVHGI